VFFYLENDFVLVIYQNENFLEMRMHIHYKGDENATASGKTAYILAHWLQLTGRELMQKLVGKLLFPLIIFLYRSSGGRIGGKVRGGDVLLLTAMGRKSGKLRTVPLIYIMDGSSYAIAASGAGGDRHPAWFLNVRSNPHVTIQVKDKQMKALAEVAGPEKKSALWRQLLQVLPFFEIYQQRTHREIPMVLLHPQEPEEKGD
jgi:F420H(2)-dependent quinone reductase